MFNQQLLHIKQIEVQNPSARGADTLYKMRFRNVKTGGKVEERIRINTAEKKFMGRAD